MRRRHVGDASIHSVVRWLYTLRKWSGLLRVQTTIFQLWWTGMLSCVPTAGAVLSAKPGSISPQILYRIPNLWGLIWWRRVSVFIPHFCTNEHTMETRPSPPYSPLHPQKFKNCPCSARKTSIPVRFLEVMELSVVSAATKRNKKLIYC